MTTNESKPRLLTFKEAAKVLRISVDSLARRANLGEITTVRIGRRRLVTQDDLHAYIAQQRQEHQRDVW